MSIISLAVHPGLAAGSCVMAGKSGLAAEGSCLVAVTVLKAAVSKYHLAGMLSPADDGNRIMAAHVRSAASIGTRAARYIMGVSTSIVPA